MEKYINEYLSVFTQKSEHIKNEVNKSVKYWLPDNSPTILLFSLVGKALVNQLDFLRESDKLEFFQHIETGMLSDNADLSTAVATGIVEGLVTASDEGESMWKRIESYLHTESKKHALSWKFFGDK
ncbi:hypothetical protein V6M93_14825 [Pectobacterium brasiliense]|uniref:hypothetical protein n=1 Tax=Pectobacterium brasiliense TaxID=180957 RepID=UPI00058306D4|nr:MULTISPECIES: hypothetical protein [Pectobacterium]KHS81747.1 hypothetical protein RC81_04025 [Pectobacterium brasiliense]KHT09281.1 hypothetical protein RC92_03865 [Pectobacterium brasiliense]OYN57181.1 hypothetical protein B7L52_01580 [Pectobacterium carotovorum]